MRVLTTFVTALKYLTLEDHENVQHNFLLAGIGNCTHAFPNADDSRLVVVETLPEGGTIHGFTKVGSNRILVHGGRFIAILEGTWKEGNVIFSTTNLREFSDWVCGTKWFSKLKSIMISCGHSTIFQCDQNSLDVKRTLTSTEKELTWSTTLFETEDQTALQAAAGTSFGDVLFWTLIHHDQYESWTHDEQNEGNETEKLCSPVHRVSVHDGPVTQLKVNDDSSRLVSTSVDRTIRVWKVRKGECSMCISGGCFVPVITHYGHLARVWDVSFLPNHTSAIVSVAEDRTCRVWLMAEENHELARFHGHAGRNVWCVDVSEKEKIINIATGGEDGSIKIRSLSAPTLISEKLSPTTNSTNRTDYNTWQIELPGKYSNPRKSGGSNKECARSLVIPQEGHLLIATDYGRILSLFQSVSCFEQDTASDKSLKWKELYRDPNGVSYTPSSLGYSDDFIFAGQSNGNVTVISRAAERDRSSGTMKVLDIPVFLDNHSIVMGLFVFSRPETGGSFLFGCSEKGELWQWSVYNRDGKTHAKYWATFRQVKTVKTSLVTSVHILDERLILVGDRGGRLLLYEYPTERDFQDNKEENSSKVVIYPMGACRPHSDRISSIIPVNSDVNTKGFDNESLIKSTELLTASFDGRITNIEVLSSQDEKGGLNVKFNILRILKSMERIETISKLVFPTSLDLVQEENTDLESISRTCLVGFRSAELLIWDVNRRNELLRINCGNWRRANDVFLDVRVGKSAGSALTVASLMLVYWRSGYLYITRTLPSFAKTQPSSLIETESLTKSVHHEEPYVQTLGTCFHGQRANAIQNIGSSSFVLTGGEDTALHVSTVIGNQWTTTQRLEKHISGVNDVSVKAITGSNESYIAASGGGCDELVIWAGKSAGGPWRSVCSTRIGEVLGEEVGKQYARHRILSVVLLESKMNDTIEEASVKVVVGRSDGSVVLVKASSRNESTLAIRDEWKIIDVKRANVQHKGAVNCIDALNEFVISGDTRGFLRVWKVVDEKIVEHGNEWIGHDGGVNCVSVKDIDEKKLMIVSGGDDERIVMNIIDEDGMRINGDEWKSKIGSHTAAVTGVALAKYEQDVLMASCGADQRIRLWKVKMDDDGKITYVIWSTFVSSVGDISDVTLKIEACILRIVVCGCGMEVVKRQIG